MSKERNNVFCVDLLYFLCKFQTQKRPKTIKSLVVSETHQQFVRGAHRHICQSLFDRTFVKDGE